MLQVPGWKRDLRGDILAPDALPHLAHAWEDLCRRSVEENVYYAPRYARALVDNVDPDIRFAAVWRDSKLIALLPFTRPKLPLPLLGPTGRAWQTVYTFNCMPLLDAVETAQAADGLLDVLASVSRGEWALPNLNTAGAACRAMCAALERRGAAFGLDGHFQRATLEADRSFDEVMNHLPSGRRRDLARNRRRLEKVGKVEHRSFRSGEGLDRAVAAFLDLEASGWKGERGTALRCHEGTRKFAIGAFTGDADSSICRADMLTLDGAPLAVSLMVFEGHTGFTVKCCYDESYRSHSPGLLLEVEVIRSFLSERWAQRLDSATAGTHVIDGLWPGRIEVADLIFSLARHGAPLRLAALRGVMRFEKKLRAGAKRAIRPR